MDTDTLKMYITTEGVKSERIMVGQSPPKLSDGTDSFVGGLVQDHHAGYRRLVVATQ